VDQLKLWKIWRAIQLGGPVMVVIKGQYGWEGAWEEAQFMEDLDIMGEAGRPANRFFALNNPLEAIAARPQSIGLEIITKSCRVWEISAYVREDTEIQVVKAGCGIQIYHSLHKPTGLGLENPGH
jgi:hypothetical protein